MESLIKKRFLAAPLLALPRGAKRALAVSLDCLLAIITSWLALCLRLESWVRFEPQHAWYMVVSIAIAIPLFTKAGLYHAIFRHAGFNALIAVARACFFYTLAYAVVFTVMGLPELMRSIGIIQPVLFTIAVAVSRLSVSLWLGDDSGPFARNLSLPRVLIYGAGSSGRQLAAALAKSRQYQHVGFVDHDTKLHNQRIDGRVVYTPVHLERTIQRLGVTDILLAMPGISRADRNAILDSLSGLPVHVRSMPKVEDLMSGRVSAIDLVELDIDDLLGREPVSPDPMLLSKNIEARTVLVTGAGGSIGSELCRQILTLKPRRLVMVEQSEFALYQIYEELKHHISTQCDLLPVLMSVTNQTALEDLFLTIKPNTVYHAAAYKHVPLVEGNVAQSLVNNVWGTWNCAKAAVQSGADHFVLISTDKAVRPTNVMGASKRLAEMVLQGMADSTKGTVFSMVRFGNVLGSSGSVVPLFRKQIMAGGPITLTHPEITRFFMTIPEAAQLVIQAGAMGESGAVYLLEMGAPVKIIELAERMVRLHGLTLKDEFNPGGDIEIVITGLRPGEKLYEELLIGDNPEPTNHQRIMKAREDYLPMSQLEEQLDRLMQSLQKKDLNQVLTQLEKLIPGYRANRELIDWNVAELLD